MCSSGNIVMSFNRNYLSFPWFGLFNYRSDGMVLAAEVIEAETTEQMDSEMTTDQTDKMAVSEGSQQDHSTSKTSVEKTELSLIAETSFNVEIERTDCNTETIGVENIEINGTDIEGESNKDTENANNEMTNSFEQVKTKTENVMSLIKVENILSKQPVEMKTKTEENISEVRSKNSKNTGMLDLGIEDSSNKLTALSDAESNDEVIVSSCEILPGIELKTNTSMFTVKTDQETVEKVNIADRSLKNGALELSDVEVGSNLNEVTVYPENIADKNDNEGKGLISNHEVEILNIEKEKNLKKPVMEISRANVEKVPVDIKDMRGIVHEKSYMVVEEKSDKLTENSDIAAVEKHHSENKSVYPEVLEESNTHMKKNLKQVKSLVNLALDKVKSCKLSSREDSGSKAKLRIDRINREKVTLENKSTSSEENDKSAKIINEPSESIEAATVGNQSISCEEKEMSEVEAVIGQNEKMENFETVHKEKAVNEISILKKDEVDISDTKRENIWAKKISSNDSVLAGNSIIADQTVGSQGNSEIKDTKIKNASDLKTIGISNITDPKISVGKSVAGTLNSDSGIESKRKNTLKDFPLWPKMFTACPVRDCSKDGSKRWFKEYEDFRNHWNQKHVSHTSFWFCILCKQKLDKPDKVLEHFGKTNHEEGMVITKVSVPSKIYIDGKGVLPYRLEEWQGEIKSEDIAEQSKLGGEVKYRRIWPQILAPCVVPACRKKLYPTYNDFMSHWQEVHKPYRHLWECTVCFQRFEKEEQARENKIFGLHPVKNIVIRNILARNKSYINPKNILPYREGSPDLKNMMKQALPAVSTEHLHNFIKEDNKVSGRDPVWPYVPTPCPVPGCNKTPYATLDEFQYHWRLIHEKNHTLHGCLICFQTFDNHKLFEIHKMEHGIDGPCKRKIVVENHMYIDPKEVRPYRHGAMKERYENLYKHFNKHKETYKVSSVNYSVKKDVKEAVLKEFIQTMFETSEYKLNEVTGGLDSKVGIVGQQVDTFLDYERWPAYKTFPDWPDMPMACPVPFCFDKTKHPNYKGFMAHWLKFHIPKVSICKCEICGREADFDHLTRHIKSHGKLQTVVNKVIVWNDLYIDPKGVKPYKFDSHNKKVEQTDMIIEIPENRSEGQQDNNDPDSEKMGTTVTVTEIPTNRTTGQTTNRPIWPGICTPCPVSKCAATTVFRGKFKSFDTFNDHWNEFHSESFALFQCEFCGSKYKTKENAENHIRKLRSHKDDVKITTTQVPNKRYIDPKGVLPYQPPAALQKAKSKGGIKTPVNKIPGKPENTPSLGRQLDTADMDAVSSKKQKVDSEDVMTESDIETGSLTTEEITIIASQQKQNSSDSGNKRIKTKWTSSVSSEHEQDRNSNAGKADKSESETGKELLDTEATDGVAVLSIETNEPVSQKTKLLDTERNCENHGTKGELESSEISCSIATNTKDTLNECKKTILDNDKGSTDSSGDTRDIREKYHLDANEVERGENMAAEALTTIKISESKQTTTNKHDSQNMDISDSSGLNLKDEPEVSETVHSTGSTIHEILNESEKTLLINDTCNVEMVGNLESIAESEILKSETDVTNKPQGQKTDSLDPEANVVEESTTPIWPGIPASCPVKGCTSKKPFKTFKQFMGHWECIHAEYVNSYKCQSCHATFKLAFRAEKHKYIKSHVGEEVNIITIPVPNPMYVDPKGVKAFILDSAEERQKQYEPINTKPVKERFEEEKISSSEEIIQTKCKDTKVKVETNTDEMNDAIGIINCGIKGAQHIGDKMEIKEDVREVTPEKYEHKEPVVAARKDTMENDLAVETVLAPEVSTTEETVSNDNSDVVPTDPLLSVEGFKELSVDEMTTQQLFGASNSNVKTSQKNEIEEYMTTTADKATQPIKKKKNSPIKTSCKAPKRSKYAVSHKNNKEDTKVNFTADTKWSTSEKNTLVGSADRQEAEVSDKKEKPEAGKSEPRKRKNTDTSFTNSCESKFQKTTGRAKICNIENQDVPSAEQMKADIHEDAKINDGLDEVTVSGRTEAHRTTEVFNDNIQSAQKIRESKKWATCRPVWPQVPTPCPVPECANKDKFTHHMAFIRHWSDTHVYFTEYFTCEICRNFKTFSSRKVEMHKLKAHSKKSIITHTIINENFIDPGCTVPYVIGGSRQRKRAKAWNRKPVSDPSGKGAVHKSNKRKLMDFGASESLQVTADPLHLKISPVWPGKPTPCLVPFCRGLGEFATFAKFKEHYEKVHKRFIQRIECRRCWTIFPSYDVTRFHEGVTSDQSLIVSTDTEVPNYDYIDPEGVLPYQNDSKLSEEERKLDDNEVDSTDGKDKVEAVQSKEVKVALEVETKDSTKLDIKGNIDSSAADKHNENLFRFEQQQQGKFSLRAYDVESYKRNCPVWPLKPSPCSVAECAKWGNFEDFADFLSHWKKVHNKNRYTFVCIMCLREFDTFRSLCRHKHNSNNKKVIFKDFRRNSIKIVKSNENYVDPKGIFPYKISDDSCKENPYMTVELFNMRPEILADITETEEIKCGRETQKTVAKNEKQMAQKVMEDDEVRSTESQQDTKLSTPNKIPQKNLPVWGKGFVFCPVRACVLKFECFQTFDAFLEHWRIAHNNSRRVYSCQPCQIQFENHRMAGKHKYIGSKRHNWKNIVESFVPNTFYIDPEGCLPYRLDHMDSEEHWDTYPYASNDYCNKNLVVEQVNPAENMMGNAGASVLEMRDDKASPDREASVPIISEESAQNEAVREEFPFLSKEAIDDFKAELAYTSLNSVNQETFGVPLPSCQMFEKDTSSLLNIKTLPLTSRTRKTYDELLEPLSVPEDTSNEVQENGSASKDAMELHNIETVVGHYNDRARALENSEMFRFEVPEMPYDYHEFDTEFSMPHDESEVTNDEDQFVTNNIDDEKRTVVVNDDSAMVANNESTDVANNKSMVVAHAENTVNVPDESTLIDYLEKTSDQTERERTSVLPNTEETSYLHITEPDYTMGDTKENIQAKSHESPSVENAPSIRDIIRGLLSDNTTEESFEGKKLPTANYDSLTTVVSMKDSAEMEYVKTSSFESDMLIRSNPEIHLLGRVKPGYEDGISDISQTKMEYDEGENVKGERNENIRETANLATVSYSQGIIPHYSRPEHVTCSAHVTSFDHVTSTGTREVREMPNVSSFQTPMTAVEKTKTDDGQKTQLPWPLAPSPCPVLFCQSFGKFLTFEEFVDHWNKIHEKAVSVFQCTFCNMKFSQLQHAEVHSGPETHRGQAFAVNLAPIKNQFYIDPKGVLPYKYVSPEEQEKLESAQTLLMSIRAKLDAMKSKK